MITTRFASIQADIRKHAPLIHCLTNPITLNDCANAILSIGGRPIMAENIQEIADITPKAHAVLLNLGCPSDLRLASMKHTSMLAAQHGIPVVIDLVGVHTSRLRMNFVCELVHPYPPAILKGNRSEIIAFSNGELSGSGIDVSPHDQTKPEMDIIQIAFRIAQRYQSIVMITGKHDIIADAQHAIILKNGTPKLAGVTGSGCVCGAVAACFASTKQHFEAAVLAASLNSIAGEIADIFPSTRGLASFRMAWLDEIGTLSSQTLCERIHYTEVKA